MDISSNLINIPADVVADMKPGQRLVRVGGRWIPVGIGGSDIPKSTNSNTGATEACWACVVEDRADDNKLKLLKLDIESDEDITESYTNPQLVPCPEQVTELKFGISTIHNSTDVKEFSITFSGVGSVILYEYGLPARSLADGVDVYEGDTIISAEYGSYIIDVGADASSEYVEQERTITIKYVDDWLTSSYSNPKIALTIPEDVIAYNHIKVDENGNELKYIKLAENMPETIFDLSGSKFKSLLNFMDSSGTVLPHNLELYSGASIAVLPYDVSIDMPLGLDCMRIPEDLHVYDQDLAVFDKEILHNIDAKRIVLRHNGLDLKETFSGSGEYAHRRLVELETSEREDKTKIDVVRASGFIYPDNFTRTVHYRVRIHPLTGGFAQTALQTCKVKRDFDLELYPPADLSGSVYYKWVISESDFDTYDASKFVHTSKLIVDLSDMYRDNHYLTFGSSQLTRRSFFDCNYFETAITQVSSVTGRTRSVWPVMHLHFNCSYMFYRCYFYQPTVLDQYNLLCEPISWSDSPWWTYYTIDARSMFESTGIEELDLGKLLPDWIVHAGNEDVDYEDLFQSFLNDSDFTAMLRGCSKLSVIKFPKSLTHWPAKMDNWVDGVGSTGGGKFYKAAGLPTVFNDEAAGITNRIPKGWEVINY